MSFKLNSNMCLATDLIGNVKELLTVLSVNRVHLRVWIQKALAFYELRQFDSFVTLLENGISRSSKSYPGYQDDLLRTYNLLAAHYVRESYRAISSRRAMLQAKATNLLQVASSMQPNERHHLVSRGYALLLTAGRAQEADHHFAAVLRASPGNMPALLGRACVAYNRRDYRDALGHFKSVLHHHPQGPADVRVGIGHCFLKLQDRTRARRAFELALEHNGRSVNALLGMALLKLNQQERASLQEGMNMLCAAYELDKRHPIVLHYLANHFYYARDFQKLRLLSANAFENTDDKEIQAQSCYQIARGFHAAGDFKQAFAYYALAAKIELPNYPQPLLGLAQMHLHRREYDKAEDCCLALLKTQPNQLQAMRLLATLYRDDKAQNKADAAIKLFTKVLLARADDYDSWVSLALLYERQAEWQQALQAYQQAKQAYEAQTASGVPVEWLNNMAALQTQAKMHREALRTLEAALARADTAEPQHRESNALTMKFNLARVHEELCNSERAEQTFKDIIREYPNYIDSYLRLGVMADAKNQIAAATEYFKDALNVDNADLAARTFLGNHYARQGHVALAMHNYNAILRNPEHFNDAYTLIAVGNIHLRNVHKAIEAGDNPNAKRQQEKALDFYKKAFDMHPRNVWAANGIGAALSSRSHMVEGGAIFKQVVESSKDCYEATLNMGHMALELGQLTQASQTYKHCLEHFSHINNNNNVELMLYLAQALFQGSRMPEAKLLLLKARHVAPHDAMLLFNLALTILQEGDSIFGQQRPALEQLKRVGREVEAAHRYLNYLAATEGKQHITQQAANSQANKCLQLLDNLSEQLSRVRELEQLDATRLRVQEERYREMQQQVEEEKKRREVDERLLRERQNVMRQELLKRTKSLINFEVVELEKKPTRKDHRKKKQGEDDDDEAEDDANEHGKTAKKRRKKAVASSRSRKKMQHNAVEANKGATEEQTEATQTRRKNKRRKTRIDCAAMKEGRESFTAE